MLLKKSFVIIEKWKMHKGSEDKINGFCEWLTKNKVDVIRYSYNDSFSS